MNKLISLALCAMAALALCPFCAAEEKAAPAASALANDIRAGMGAVEELLALDSSARVAKLFALKANLELPKAERDAAMRAAMVYSAEMHPFVRNRLAKGSAEDRQFAATLLGEFGIAEDEALLREASSSKEASVFVRDHALAALEKIYRRMSPDARCAKLEECLPHLDSEDTSAVACAILASFMPRQGEGAKGKPELSPERMERLLQIIREAEAISLRYYAAEALSGVSLDIEAVGKLKPLLVGEKEPQVRTALCRAIGGTAEGSHNLLCLAMNDADPMVKVEAAGAITRLRSDAAATKVLLDAAVSGEAFALRKRALELIAAAPKQEMAGALLALLDDKSWLVRSLAIKSLGLMPGRAVTPKLGKMLDDEDARVVYEAAIAMNKQGVVSSKDRFYKNLGHKNPMVRAAMANALQEIGSRADAGEIARNVGDSDATAAAAAVQALGEIAWRQQGNAVDLALPGDFANPLAIAMKDKRFCVSFAAAEALAKLTGLPFTTVPAKASADWERLRLEKRK